MDVVEGAEAEKIQDIKELERQAERFCKDLLKQLFILDIQSKGSNDTTLAYEAQVHKNSILYILQMVMSFSPTEHVTPETLRFMEEYAAHHAGIIQRYEGIINEEEAALQQSRNAAAAIEEGKVLAPNNIRRYFPPKARGGRRKTRRR
jgi:hypothetical protein